MPRTSMFALGALGGLLPILVSLLTVDLAPFFDGATTLTPGNYAGYGVRILVLLVLGGVMASLNSEVRNPMALVQLGIAAPALITSYINGASLRLPTATNTTGIAFVSRAYADSNVGTERYVVAEGFLSDFTQGFGTRLDALDRQNRYAKRPSPPSQTPQPDQQPGWGAFCQTSAGTFRITALTPLGTPCAVPTNGVLANGTVVAQ